VKTVARELRPLDVSDQPELRRVAEEVYATQEPRVLRRDNEDLAILRPARRARATRGKRALTKDDPLWALVGSAVDADLTDASEKHAYLGEAPRPDRS
jgi:hypothetical protein